MFKIDIKDSRTTPMLRFVLHHGISINISPLVNEIYIPLELEILLFLNIEQKHAQICNSMTFV